MTTNYEITVKATALHFTRSDFDKMRWVVLADKDQPIDFFYRYPDVNGLKYRQATGVNMQGGCPRWYMVLVEDCMDPPIAIVNAESAQEAEEEFANELDWAHYQPWEEENLHKEMTHINDAGVPYETESIRIHEVALVAVELLVPKSFTGD